MATGRMARSVSLCLKDKEGLTFRMLELQQTTVEEVWFISFQRHWKGRFMKKELTNE